MFHRRREFLRLRQAFSDTVVTALSFELAYLLRQALPQFRLFYLTADTMTGLLIVAAIVWPLTGASVGLYRSPEPAPLRKVTALILRQTVWSAVALTFLLYVFKFGDVSRLFMLLFVAMNAILLFGWRVATAILKAASDSMNKRHYVIVGTGEHALEVARLIAPPGNRTAEIRAFIRESESADNQAADNQAAVTLPAPVGGANDLIDLLHDHVVDEVIFAIDRERMPEMEELFSACQERGVKVRMLVNFFPRVAAEVSLDYLHELPLLTFSAAPDNDYLLFLKRIFDILVGVPMALLFAPAALVAMALIRLTSEGPVFFVQERSGLNGRRFKLYKFRSMYCDAEEKRALVANLNEMDGPVFKCANDPRITPVGKFLRRFSIDEWPQLINVIKGDMSLVGPRPPLPEEVEQYKPWQRRRLRMRPGLTCLWVLGGRNQLDFLNWMRLDLHYIDHWSLGLDCKILLQSIPHVLSGKGM